MDNLGEEQTKKKEGGQHVRSLYVCRRGVIA